MIKIVHVADLHLDAPFSDCDSFEKGKRRAEQKEALSGICDVCKREKADILLIAGDLFDGDFISLDTPAFLCELFSGIPDTRVFISPGNHDYYHAKSPYKAVRFPDNVHIFTEETMSCVELPKLDTCVYGYAFTAKRMSVNPFENFHVKDENKINILCGHADLDTPASEYFNISGEYLEKSGLCYAALGHIHKRSGFLHFGKTVCAYSGCLLGRGFDECGETGGIIGEVGIGNVALRYLPLDMRRYEVCEIKLSDAASEDAVLSEIYEKCSSFDEKVSLRIILSGTCSFDIEVSTDKVRQALKRPLYIEMKNELIFLPDTESIEKENSLRGEFCRKIKPLLDTGDTNSKKVASLALKYGISALSGQDFLE